MKTDIGIWKIDRESRSGSKLDHADRIETEKMLEDVLVANPNVLMDGLILVGRQVPVGSGYIDLLAARGRNGFRADFQCSGILAFGRGLRMGNSGLERCRAEDPLHEAHKAVQAA